jgi:hypothetical protein
LKACRARLPIANTSDGGFRGDGLTNNFKPGLFASRLILNKCCEHDTAKAFTGMLLQLQLLAEEYAMYVRCLAALAAASLMGGCAIHPVPEDVTGLDTASIVKQIRCETRDAARKMILDQLKFLTSENEDPIARNLYEKYSANPELMLDFDPNHEFAGSFYDATRNAFNLIYGAGVAYTFDLTMTETNDINSTTNFLGTWQPAFTMNLAGDVNRSRQNRRTFTITDKFSFLLRDLNLPRIGTTQPYCDGYIALGPNYIYPIAGKIGMHNTVHTFLQLSVFENLGPNKNVNVGATGAPAMVEDLTFTTLVDLVPTPKFTFVPLKRGFEVADTSLKATFSRKDMHQVTVGLALEPSGTVALTTLRGFVFPGPAFSGRQAVSGRQIARGRNGASTSTVLNSVIANPTSNAELIALYAVDQRKSSELQLRAAQ